MRSATTLREARLRAGLTQAELAARIGSTQSVIARWEGGGALPSHDTLARVVRACGFELSTALVPVDPSETSLIERNLQLGPQDRLDQLVRVVRFIESGRTRLGTGA